LILHDGLGFASQYADRLFGVFQRLHRQEKFEGTRIELATLQRLFVGSRVCQALRYRFVTGYSPDISQLNRVRQRGLPIL
jgi:hypothetical protein